MGYKGIELNTAPKVRERGSLKKDREGQDLNREGSRVQQGINTRY